MNKETIFQLEGSTDCAVHALRSDVIDAVVNKALAGTCPPNRPGAAPAAATITISLECWRDENNKLHCKLSVGLSAA